MPPRIQPKPYDVPAHARTLLSALRGAARREITVADAAVASGLPLDRCEAALIHLGARFDVRIRTTSQGELLFTFASLTRERSRLAEKLAHLRARARAIAERVLAIVSYFVVPNLTLMAAGHVAALLFVVCDLPLPLAVPLAPPVFVVALLLFCAGFLGFFFMQLAPLMGLAFFVSGIALPVYVLVYAITHDALFMLSLEVILLPLSATFVQIGYLALRDLASGARHLVSRESLTLFRDATREVAGFLLGPRDPDVDGFEDERRVVALLRARRGVLTTSDLMVHFGTTREDADREATRVLADYGGEIVVTDEGALVYTFDALLRSASEPHRAPDIRPAWEREGTPRFFGCHSGGAAAALLSIALALLGLALHPRLVLFPDRAYFASMDSAYPSMLLEGAGAIPYLVPLAILAARVPSYVLARLRHARRAQLLALLARAYAGKGALEVPRVDTRLLVSLGGELVPEASRADGLLHLRFPLLRDELRAAEAQRQRAVETDVGEVIFDTHAGGERG